MRLRTVPAAARNAAVWRISTIKRLATSRGPRRSFTCNLCAHRGWLTPRMEGRECRSCLWCGSTTRYRAVVASLSNEVHGRIIPLVRWHGTSSLRGIGFSDHWSYARRLAGVTNYTNTWFHQEPQRDLLDLTTFGDKTYDFVICSDVMEHVASPVALGFATLFSILRPGGVLVFTVPTVDGPTTEHYPPLRTWVVEKATEGWMVVAEGSDGSTIRDLSPVFHGGPGATLEMRVFGRDDLREHLSRAGFIEASEQWLEDTEFGLSGRRTNESESSQPRGLDAGVWVARRPL